MSRALITVSNYRGFGNTPQVIEIDKGFTSFVGLNNAGKSSILKLFYEFRPLWERLSHPTNLLSILQQSGTFAVTVAGVRDAEEVFNHFNEGSPIIFSFSFPEVKKNIKFSLRVVRMGPNQPLTSVRVNIHELVVDGKDAMQHARGESHSGDGTHSLTYTYEDGATRGSASMPVEPTAAEFALLANAIYLPSFRNIVNVGEKESLYDISTGTAFIKQWEEWQGGDKRVARGKIIAITESIRDLFGYRSLHIMRSTDGTTLALEIDGKPYSLHEVGSGLAQFILSFASVAIRNPTYVLIDEPELNLHPSLQLKFVASIGALASEGVICATHSLGLARSTQSIFSVTKEAVGTVIRPFNATVDYSTLIGELSFSAYREVGFEFALIVEGVTEMLIMQELLRKLGKDTKVFVMGAGGNDLISGKREPELTEIRTRLGVPVYAWIDSEKKDAADPLEKRRQDFLALCKKVGIEAKASGRRATENYFTQQALSAASAGKKPKTQLGDFDLPPATENWSKNDNWKVARHLTKDELLATDLGQFLESIK